MKGAFVEVLQTRMDKCTTEQFWAVGALTAFSAFLITQIGSVSAELPAWTIIAVSLALGLYVAYFIIQRHFAYYSLLSQLVDLLTGDPSTPESVKQGIQLWTKGRGLAGVTFYLACDLVVTAGVLAAYL